MAKKRFLSIAPFHLVAIIYCEGAMRVILDAREALTIVVM